MFKRFWEIDALRGSAIVLMVLFNYAFALSFFGIHRVDAGWVFWFLFPRLIASLFIFVAGISFVLSYSRIKTRIKSKKVKTKNIRKKYLRRGLQLFGLGLLITAVTWILFPSHAILFGILHFLGVAMVLAPLFRNLKRMHLLIFGILFIAIGIALQGFTVSFPWLLWLGFVPAGFQTLDYFPLFPWLGMFLFGMAAGNVLYRDGKRCFSVREKLFGAGWLQFLGRHSLFIYIVHQPVLVGILLALGYSLF